MNNNEVDCNRLKAAFSKFKEMLGDDNEDSQLWHWLFSSAIECGEYRMARKVIQKISVQMRIEAMTILAVKSKEEEYLEEVIELAHERIEKEDDIGYRILIKVIKAIMETKEEELTRKAFEEAKKIKDDVYRNRAMNIILSSVSTKLLLRAENLEDLTLKEDETLEEMFQLAMMATEVIVAASKG